MKIPYFVEARKRTKKERAAARLKYVLAVISAKHTGRQSMRALAEKVELDHSTLSTYIRRGSFSVAAAERIVGAIDNCEVTVDQLVDPLTMERFTV